MPRKSTSSVHSIRCTDELWSRANTRARREGTSMNRVITEIMEGYASGQVNLPRVVKVFEEVDSGEHAAASVPHSAA